jgi:hypothetical protein
MSPALTEEEEGYKRLKISNLSSSSSSSSSLK